MVSRMAGLDEHQYAVVRALLPIMLGLDENEPGESARVDQACDRLSDFFASLDRPDVYGSRARALETLLTALHWVILVEFETKASELTFIQRQTFVGELFEPDATWVGKYLIPFLDKALGKEAPTQLDVARSLREMCALAYYTGQGSNAFTGYTNVWNRDEVKKAAPDLQPAPDAIDVDAILAKHRERIDVPTDQLFAHDGRPKVAVIGSGAGGAVMAAVLASTGKYDVAVFEAGPRFSPAQYPLETMSAMSMICEDGVQTLTKNLDVQLLRGRVVGGSTVLTSGMTIRTRPKTLAHWQTLGIPQQAMNDGLDWVQKRLQIEKIQADLTCDPGNRWKAGGVALNENVMFDVPESYVVTRKGLYGKNGEPAPTPERRGDRCLGCGLCNYGCHFGHKLSCDLTFIPDAEQGKAKIHPNLGVKSLTASLDDQGKARITGLILYRDPYGQPIPVDYVVLAGGAVGSAALLLRSMDKEASLAWLPCRDEVGQKLGFNYGATVIAQWKDLPPKPGDAGLQISFVASKPEDETFVLESAYVAPSLMSTLVPGIGADHRAWMKSYRRLAMCVNTIGSPQTGSIDADGNVHYALSDAEMQVVRETMSLITRMFLRAGAERVGFSGVRGSAQDPAIFQPGDETYPEKLLDRIVKAVPDAERVMLASAHPQGGLRFGKTDQDGVVGDDFRVHGVGNLFVADASVFPSTIVVNPQWTVMALSKVASGRVMARIDAERAGATKS
jgi:choline dehydrogenase-like flavoprotein